MDPFLEDEVKEQEAEREGYSKGRALVIVAAVALPVYFIVLHIGGSDRARTASLCFAMNVIAIGICWDLRKHIWFCSTCGSGAPHTTYSQVSVAAVEPWKGSRTSRSCRCGDNSRNCPIRAETHSKRAFFFGSGRISLLNPFCCRLVTRARAHRLPAA